MSDLNSYGPPRVDLGAWEQSVDRDIREALANDVLVKNAVDKMRALGFRSIDWRAVVAIMSKRNRELQAELNKQALLIPRRYRLPNGQVVQWSPKVEDLPIEDLK